MEQLILGLWNVLCDRCGRKFKSNEVQKEPHTGLIVCKDTCWEPRHPQDFLRSRPDNQSVPFSRPEPPDSFVGPTYIDESVGTQERTAITGTFDDNNGTI